LWNEKEHEMQNVTVDIKNDRLTITIDLKQKGAPSKSGKTVVIASTQGNQPVADGLYLGLNVYRKPSK
jgi:hypothetical protein